MPKERVAYYYDCTGALSAVRACLIVELEALTWTPFCGVV